MTKGRYMYKCREGGDHWACVHSSGLVICPPRGVLQSQHSSGRVGGQPLAPPAAAPEAEKWEKNGGQAERHVKTASHAELGRLAKVRDKRKLPAGAFPSLSAFLPLLPEAGSRREETHCGVTWLAASQHWLCSQTHIRRVGGSCRWPVWGLS